MLVKAKFQSVFTVHYAKSFEIFEIHPNSSVLTVYYAARCAAALNWVGLLYHSYYAARSAAAKI